MQNTEFAIDSILTGWVSGTIPCIDYVNSKQNVYKVLGE